MIIIILYWLLKKFAMLGLQKIQLMMNPMSLSMTTSFMNSRILSLIWYHCWKASQKKKKKKICNKRHAMHIEASPSCRAPVKKNCHLLLFFRNPIPLNHLQPVSSLHFSIVSRKLVLEPNRHLDIHAAELLDQELGSIRHGDFAHSLFALAQLAVATVAHLAACL